MAWNVTAGNAQDQKTINVVSGTKTASVTITKPASSGEKGDFYSKSGSIWTNDPDHVYWYLNTNTGQESVREPLNIIDQVQPGQKIVPGSFTIYNTSNSESYSGANSIEDFEKAHPNSSISYNVDNGTVSIVLDPTTVNGINWIIVFNTEITNKSNASFANNSSINYWPENSVEPKTLNSNASVENPYAEGGISGVPVGTLLIKKVIKSSNGTLTDIPIQGIQFKLINLDGSNVVPGETSVILTTDSAGEAKIGNLVDGNYQLTEENVPDWLNPLPGPIDIKIDSNTGQGVLETIGNTKKTINITANKVWNTSETTTPTVWFKLYRSIASGTKEAVPNAPIKSLVSGTASVTWSGLDYSDNVGNVYTYSVQEVNAQGLDFTPIGYNKTESGLTVTNTIKTIPVTVNKTWVDSNNQDGLRPNQINVYLNADGEVIGNPKILSSTAWSYKWTNLPMYNNGKKIVYTVTEDTVGGYKLTTSSLINGIITLTNSHTPQTTSITVNKVWIDNNNQDGLRPTQVRVVLNANGNIVNAPIYLKVGAWSYTWTNLPKYSSGKEIIYTVTESPVNGYTLTSSSISNGIITLTNTHTPQITSITVNKVWADKNNEDGLRPTQVRVELNANGKVVGIPIDLKDETWSYTWTNLPVYNNGKKIAYTIKEDLVNGYKSTVSAIKNGVITLVNTYNVKTTSVTVNKIWLDNNNQNYLRPEKISLLLMANGIAVGDPIYLTGSPLLNVWTHTWSDLPEYNNGEKIIYTIVEEPINGYKSTVSDISEGVITITNTRNIFCNCNCCGCCNCCRCCNCCNCYNYCNCCYCYNYCNCN